MLKNKILFNTAVLLVLTSHALFGMNSGDEVMSVDIQHNQILIHLGNEELNNWALVNKGNAEAVKNEKERRGIPKVAVFSCPPFKSVRLGLSRALAEDKRTVSGFQMPIRTVPVKLWASRERRPPEP